VTAFPILARILHEHGIASTHLGRTAMSTAALNDLAGWLPLIVALPVARGGTPMVVLGRLGGVVALILFFVFVVQPLLRLAMEDGLPGPESGSRLAFVLAILVAEEAQGSHRLVEVREGYVNLAGLTLTSESIDRLARVMGKSSSGPMQIPFRRSSQASVVKAWGAPAREHGRCVAQVRK
jgi:hypothetical protein